MRRVVVVTGLSGAGKASILRAFEDIGFEAIDNAPLSLVEPLALRGDRPLVLGLDARTEGFDAPLVLSMLDRLRLTPGLQVSLVYATAEPVVLLRRYTETRRRHPLAPEGRVTDGIEREVSLTLPLRDAADLVIDTSELPLPVLRRTVETQFGPSGPVNVPMAVTLMSFAFPAGLPREADMVFDARFLRNPHYDPILRPRTGLDPQVAAFVEADPDYEAFFSSLQGLLGLVLPRFVHEGKKYATIAIGCTGGRHRSVRTVARLAPLLAELGDTSDGPGWLVSTVHRELTKAGAPVLGVVETAPLRGASGKV